MHSKSEYKIIFSIKILEHNNNYLVITLMNTKNKDKNINKSLNL